MVKNKKMSKSAVAIIVLSLLLVLSMVMGLTGAWFTDKEAGMSASGAVKEFGHVELTQGLGADTGWSNQYSEVSGDAFKAMPGSRYDLAAGNIDNGSNVKIYVLVQFNAVKLTLRTGAEKTAEEEGTEYSTSTSGICTIVSPSVTTNEHVVATSYADMFAVDAGEDVAITAGSVVLDTAIGNTYMDGDAKVEYSVKIAAIQFANIDADAAHAQLLALFN